MAENLEVYTTFLQYEPNKLKVSCAVGRSGSIAVKHSLGR